MSDVTDSAIGAVGGLLALGIVANVATKMIKTPKIKPIKLKPMPKLKRVRW